MMNGEVIKEVLSLLFFRQRRKLENANSEKAESEAKREELKTLSAEADYYKEQLKSLRKEIDTLFEAVNELKKQCGIKDDIIATLKAENHKLDIENRQLKKFISETYGNGMD